MVSNGNQLCKISKLRSLGGRSGLDLYLVSGWQCVNSSLNWMPFWNGCLSNQRLSHTFTSQKRKMTIRVYTTACLGQCEASKHDANIKPLKASDCGASFLDDNRQTACLPPSPLLIIITHTHILCCPETKLQSWPAANRGGMNIPIKDQKKDHPNDPAQVVKATKYWNGLLLNKK